MPPSLQSRTVPFREIEFNDTTFSLEPDPTGEPSEELRQSILNVGLLHPPILKKYDHGYQIVAGRKRLLIIRDELAARSCYCQVLPAECSEAQGLKIALTEAKLTSRLSPAIKAILIQKISAQVPAEELIYDLLPLLDLPPRQESVDLYLKLAGLELPIIVALHMAELDPVAAANLCDLSFRDRMAIFDCISMLKLSVGNQKKLIEICRELARRNRCEISAIVTEPAVQEILDHPGANMPQKAANLMKWLARQRNPALTGAEDEFLRFAGSFALPRNMELSHALSFETDRLTLSITFKNRDDFVRLWPGLKETLC